MISNRICAFAFSAALLIICPIQPAFAAQSDGSWKMVLKTTNTAIAVNIGVAVNRGHISATSGSFVMHRILLDGRTGGSGATKINGIAVR